MAKKSKHKNALIPKNFLVFTSILGVCLFIFILLKTTLTPRKASINVIGVPQNTLANPVVSVLTPITESKLYFNDDTGVMNAEVTPWALGTKRLGGWYTYLTSTYDTFMCSTPSNIFTLKTTENITDNKNCILRQEPEISPSNLGALGSIPLWKRDYYGTFSAHIIKIKSLGDMVYSINHGESYNNSDLAIRFPSSQKPPCVAVANMGYGSLPCEPNYWWGSYNAYISLSSMPWNYTNLIGNTKFSDLGPITWPSNGYVESLDGGKNWIKATDGGIRTPTSIIKDNYLYVYYEDLSLGKESEGRGPGIKVIRAPITDNGIDPKSFKAYYNGGFSQPSLPQGFNLPTYYNSLAARGPRSSNIFPGLVRQAPKTLGTGRTDSRTINDVISFSVAKVNGTPYYLGVGHDLSQGTTLRLSTDLVTWSNPTVIDGTQSDWWSGKVDLQSVPLLYPRLMNNDGDSNNDIDPQEFYVVGTQTKLRGSNDAKIVNFVKLKLTLP